MAIGGVSFNLAPMVKLVHWSSQLIGLCPYKLPEDINSDHFGMSMPMAIYTITVATLSAVGLIFHLLENYTENVSRSNLLNFTMKTLLLGGVFYHLVGILFMLMIRRRLWVFLRNICDVDDKLQSLGVQFNYSRQYWFVQMFTVFWISFAGVLFTIHCYSNLHAFGSISTFFVKIFSHAVAVWTYGTIMSHFFFCLMLIYTRFVCLNIAFRHRLLHDDVPKNVDNIVTRFRIIHDTITDAVAKVNSILSLMAMMGVTVTIFFTVLTINALYKKFTPGIDEQPEYGSYFLWVSYFTFMALINIIVASVLSTEGKSTCILVNKALNRSVLASNVRHLRLFSQQLRIRAPIVTCWLYNYDWELIYTMCGTISMYTLIFIQFDILAAQNQQSN